MCFVYCDFTELPGNEEGIKCSLKALFAGISAFRLIKLLSFIWEMQGVGLIRFRDRRERCIELRDVEKC